MAKDDLNAFDALMLMAEKVRRQATHPDMSGYKPHVKQLAFHKSDDYLRLYIGGNRAGKTHGGVMEDLYWATGTHPFLITPPPPVYIRVVVTDLLQGLNDVMIPKFKALCRDHDLKGGSWDRAYNKYERLLSFKNGSEIQFMSYEQDVQKFAGASKHLIHFDEEPPKDIFVECSARVIDTAGKLIMTMTPIDGITWVHDEIYQPASEAEDKEIIIAESFDPPVAPVYRHPEKETTIVEVASEENPYLDPKSRERFFNSLESEEDREARSKGKFISVGGKVFPEFDKSTHVIPMIDNPREYFRGWYIYTSTDHGWNNPTAWLWHAVSPDGTIITFWEHYKTRMTIAEHAAVVKGIERQFDLPIELRVGDPAMSQHSAITGTSILQEYALQGLPIATDMIPHDASVGIAKMHQYFRLRGTVVDSDGKVLHPGKPTWFVTENCVNTIRELRGLMFDKFDSKKTAFKNNKKESVQKKNDHAFDSMKYFATSRPDLAPDQAIVEDTLSRLRAGGAILGYTGTQMPYDKALLEIVERREQAEQDNGWTVIESFV